MFMTALGTFTFVQTDTLKAGGCLFDSSSVSDCGFSVIWILFRLLTGRFECGKQTIPSVCWVRADANTNTAL